MKKYTLLLLLCLLSLGVGKGLHFLRDGFTFRRIQSVNVQASEAFNEETQAALKQTYTYLGRGRQCFAFESEDHRYVLKFPRTDIYKLPLWARALPLKNMQAALFYEKEKRKAFVLKSFEIAFNELKEQTAMVAIHLGKSPSTQKLKLIDKLGAKHEIPLGNTSFALQYKKPILSQQISAALQAGDLDEAKKMVEALRNTIQERASKAILNKDRSFLKNFGYDGKSAYQIDVGSFYRNPNLSQDESTQKSMSDSLEPVYEWLSQIDPQLIESLNSHV